MIDISLILPTRERPEQLRRALESLCATAEHPESIEVVLYIDRDDDASKAFEFQGVRLVRIVGPRTSMGRMTADCYAASTGSCIMLGNDDMAFRTPGWDQRVLREISSVPDGVLLLWGNDLETGAPAHPFLTRQLIQLMGGVCPVEYRRILIDTHIYDIFRKLHSLGHNRFRYLPDMVIEHLCPSAGKAAVDSVYNKSHTSADEQTYILWDDERLLLAHQLAGHIAAFARQGSARMPAQASDPTTAAPTPEEALAPEVLAPAA
jgi:hypothetical protein